MKKNILLFSIAISIIAKAQTKSIVHFDSGKSNLKGNSIKVLDSIAEILKNKSTYKIVINGYCDNTGSDELNQPLSEQRAKCVFMYFNGKKLNAGNIFYNGQSFTNPIDDNNTEIGKAKNRRVEIIITIKESAPVVVKKIAEPELIITQISTTPEKPKMLDDNSKTDDLAVGEILILKNLNFVGGTSELLKESEPSLKLLLKTLKDNPTMEIEVEGHVCCANDMALSVDRALIVVEYLVNNGINEKRLKYEGHGWNNPISSDATEAGRKSNRRVEIMILKK